MQPALPLLSHVFASQNLGAPAWFFHSGRFAAKEAVMKALGTGVRGVSWRDIEVARHESGAPSILLHGRAKRRAQRLGVCEISVSMSHSRDYAVAFVVVQREPSS